MDQAENSMNGNKTTIVIGAGIVGISTALWLCRSGVDVTVIDKADPGEGTSFGNAGVLARCSVVPVTSPGLISSAPKLLLQSNSPLFVRLSYMPRMIPWLIKYLSNANDKDTRRIAESLAPLTSDSVEQHLSLVQGTAAENWVQKSNYSFVYPDRVAFDADAYTWELRRLAGFEPELIEGQAVQEFEPMLSPNMKCLAVMRDHGFVKDPGAYVKSLAQEVQKLGGRILKSEVKDLTIANGQVRSVQTDQGEITCSKLVLAAGVWSKPLAKKLGLSVPIETERGYHLVFTSPSELPRGPLMVSSGKFVATPMAGGLRCAGIIEFGGLKAKASKNPLKFLQQKVQEVFPNLTFQGTESWLGHRPAPTDSLPLIGEIGNSGVITGFGHHHIGLTSGPKTGRLVAELITHGRSSMDLSAYSPNRFH